MFAGISAEGLEKGIFIGSSFRLRLRFRQYWFTLGSLRRKHDGSRRGDGRKRNRSVPSVSASVELVLPSPFSWFTLERKDSSVSAFVFVFASVASVNQALKTTMTCQLFSCILYTSVFTFFHLTFHHPLTTLASMS